MTERIIDFLDALVATVGAVDKRYCLVEKRADVNGTNIPYKYKGNGNYEAVNVDGGSVSYWRIVNSISFDVVDGNKAVKNLQATYPIRYVAMVRRDDINPLTFSQDVANVLEGRNKDLQTQLQAKNVNITVGSIDTDTVKIWSEEFAMPLTEPNYTRSMVMIDLTVTVIAARSCWESCDDLPDILQGFDWCDPSTYQRLTPAQITCLEGFLCGTCADATVQLNGTTVGTIASGDTESFTVNLDGSPSGSWDGTAWQVTSPPCADATVELNSVQMATIPSGGTENIQVMQSSGSTLVGSQQGQYWRIGDSPISLNGTLVDNVKAEDSLNIPVIQDGSPAGSWNGTQWVVPSCPAGGSISVAVSDASPDVWDTITITATPNGFTPVRYFCEIRLGTILIFVGDNGTGIFNYTVDFVGSAEVFVYADDGSTASAFNIGGSVVIAALNPSYFDNAAAWYDASDASTVTIATGVSAWANKVSGGLDLTQAVGSAQPAYLTAYQNGLNAIKFDGTDDFLATSAAVLNGLNWHMMIAFRAVEEATTRHVIGQRIAGVNGRTDIVLNQNPSSGTVQPGVINAYPHPTILAGTSFVTDNYILEFENSAGNLTVRRNGTVTATGTTATAILNAVLRVGSLDGLSFFSNSHFYEIWLFNAAQPSAKRTNLYNYLSAKWNI